MTSNQTRPTASPANSKFPALISLFTLLLILASLLAAWPARAEEPDDSYLVIYSLVQQADALNSSGKTAPALAKYREANTALQAFQKSYPTWNVKAVTFRANYVAQKIAALTEKAATAQAAGTATNAQGAPSGTKAAAAASKAQVKLLDAGAEPRKVLRLHPKPGDQQKVEVAIKMTMATKVGEMEVPAMKLPAMKFTLATTVKSVADNGDIAYEVAVGDANVADDPGAMPQIAQAMKSMLSGLNGMSGTGSMSSRGFNLETRMKVPGGGDPQARQIMDQFKDSLSNLGNALPEEAAGPGAKWEAKLPIKYQGMTIDQTTTYQLVSMEGERLVAKVSITQQAANQKVSSAAMPGLKADLTKMAGSGTGEITIDLTKLLPASETADSQSEFSMTVNAGGQKQSMAQKLDQNIRMETK